MIRDGGKFHSWRALKRYVKDTEDTEFLGKMMLIEKYRCDELEVMSRDIM